MTDPRSGPGCPSADASARELRTRLEQRLPGLLDRLTTAPLRRLARGLGWALLLSWLAFASLIVVLRHVVLPGVGDYRNEIEQLVSRTVGQPVRIGRIEARWQGLNPDLVLDEVDIVDNQGAPAFSLTRVEAVLSWHSLWRLRPSLALLALEGPVLHVRRETSGKITIAGVDAEGESDPALARWVLEQKRIRIRNATIVWEDQRRDAPPLLLEDLQLALDNQGRRHRFGLSAAPPERLAARVDVRGEIDGDPGEDLTSLAGKLFVELDYADLAGWQSWVDYPLNLPKGRGALRLWADFSEGEGRLTTDVALEELRIRFGQTLPELDLASMRGRLEARHTVDEWTLSGQRVELSTDDGVRIPPTDFKLAWRQRPGSPSVTGHASASFLDLSALGRLAEHMPLNGSSRELLLRHRPRGQINELRAGWTLEGDELQRYSLTAEFGQLGMLPGGYFPGASGLSGKLDLTEKGGEAVIEAHACSLTLPAVFPEPEIVLDSLNARAHWKKSGPVTDLWLDKVTFDGPDAAGHARGSYRHTGSGPGEIDLVAGVERLDGRAVWRYMPHAVNAEVRNWLKRGIVAGRGHDGRLVLKGALKDFPFRDGKAGKFLVTAKGSGIGIDYADGWPALADVEADMSFSSGMKITAGHGQILGVALSGLSAEIPDFESHDEKLLIRGRAHGATSDFLRFIDQSPVSEKIDHFTTGMSALGNGNLNLELDMPLRQVDKTRLRGEYRFHHNQLHLISGLPPLTQVNGRLSLTENSLSARDIDGRVFGGPLRVQVNSVGDKVGVQAAGTAAIAEVSRHFGWPLIDHLAGTAGWRADVSIRRRNAELVVESDLTGISSPLPEPLNKAATAPLALRIERSTPDPQQEIYRMTLGKAARAVIVRRSGRWERGVFAVGEAEPRLPEHGLAVRVAVPAIDLDRWRNFHSIGPASEDGGTLPLSVVALKTPVLRLFGRDYHQVESTLSPRDGGWQIGLNTREAQGELFWRNVGEGWVEGAFKRLYIRTASDVSDEHSALINSLPGMSLGVEDFRLGELALGKLELKARNARGAWHLDTLSLENPDGRLKGKGLWVNGGPHRTQLNFELTASDAGKLLDRLGYGNTLRRGQARLNGELRWNGPLTALHYPSLNGQLTLEADKGQFAKLEPGVGKLLGLISLQSLPRRLTLDFRDIFSDGLAFDSIEGQFSVNKGVMRTVDPLRIVGPAAQIEMLGEADLKSETQDLHVVVRPEVGGLAAVGAAALVNPVIGAAALVANTVLQKPLNRLFSYRYHVTGTWAEPLVDKTGQTNHENAPPNEETGQ